MNISISFSLTKKKNSTFRIFRQHFWYVKFFSSTVFSIFFLYQHFWSQENVIGTNKWIFFCQRERKVWIFIGIIYLI